MDIKFKVPRGLAIDQSTGTLFVSDEVGNGIYSISPQGIFIYFLFSLLLFYQIGCIREESGDGRKRWQLIS